MALSTSQKIRRLFNEPLDGNKRINSNVVKQAENIALRDGTVSSKEKRAFQDFYERDIFTKAGWSEFKSFARQHDVSQPPLLGGGED
jgi:hypothetical protein